MNGICKIKATTIEKTKTKKKKKTEVGKTLCQGLRRMYKLFAIMDKKNLLFSRNPRNILL